MTYKDKLRDPRWQKKRLQIFTRDNWTCLSCGSKDKNLQVHHIVYSKLDPWDYPDHLCQTLCDECHEIRQELTDKAVHALRIAIKDIPTARLAMIAQRLCNSAMEAL